MNKSQRGQHIMPGSPFDRAMLGGTQTFPPSTHGNPKGYTGADQPGSKAAARRLRQLQKNNAATDTAPFPWQEAEDDGRGAALLETKCVPTSSISSSESAAATVDACDGRGAAATAANSGGTISSSASSAGRSATLRHDPRAKRGLTSWTQEEDDRLTALWTADAAIAAIARELQRTTGAIKNRAGDLDLPTRKPGKLRRYDEAVPDDGGDPREL